MKPAIGRIVHYVVASGSHRPAIVIQLDDLAIDLHVFVDPTNDGLIPFQCGVSHDEMYKKLGTWHWPEREDTPPRL